uniref:SPIN-DOC-like zinc-finger domain-containing protein n=1 Tax=Latimeria chalumnae TaxID=7897 RepID=H2ZY15_LATCH
FQDQWTEKYFVIKKDGKPLCLLCKKNYNIKRHYETKHAAYDQYVGEQRKRRVESLHKELTTQQSFFRKSGEVNEAATHASLVAAYEIAKHRKTFSDDEFLKNCMLRIAAIACPEKKSAFANVSLSRMTIGQRVEDIATDIQSQLFITFSLVLDDNTDIEPTAQLLIFVCGVMEEFEISEELLALISLKDRTRGHDIFEMVCDEMERNGLRWPRLVGVTTDGAPCMTGEVSGLVGLIKKRGKEIGCSEIINYHCIIIHQEAIVSSVINLEGVMDTVVECVNFIKSKRKDHHLPQLTDEAWLCDLSFLVDVIGHLNDLNLKLQGQGHFASAMFDHIKAFERRIKLLQKHLSKGNFTHFSAYKELSVKLQEAGGILPRFTSKEEFERRFQDFQSHENELILFADPFSFDIVCAPGNMQLELIELQESSQFKAEYQSQNLAQFCANLPAASFLHLRAHVLRIASLFGSTYVCEKTFSLLNHNKSE